MFLKKSDKNNLLEDPSSHSAIDVETQNIETFNVLKNKNQWILLRDNEERPIFFSSIKNVVIGKVKDFSSNKEFRVNIFNVDNELITSKILIKN